MFQFQYVKHFFLGIHWCHKGNNTKFVTDQPEIGSCIAQGDKQEGELEQLLPAITSSWRMDIGGYWTYAYEWFLGGWIPVVTNLPE